MFLEDLPAQKAVLLGPDIFKWTRHQPSDDYNQGSSSTEINATVTTNMMPPPLVLVKKDTTSHDIVHGSSSTEINADRKTSINNQQQQTGLSTYKQISNNKFEQQSACGTQGMRTDTPQSKLDKIKRKKIASLEQVLSSPVHSLGKQAIPEHLTRVL
jgi:hypothetical protein